MATSKPRHYDTAFVYQRSSNRNRCPYMTFRLSVAAIPVLASILGPGPILYTQNCTSTLNLPGRLCRLLYKPLILATVMVVTRAKSPLMRSVLVPNLSAEYRQQKRPLLPTKLLDYYTRKQRGVIPGFCRRARCLAFRLPFLMTSP